MSLGWEKAGSAEYLPTLVPSGIFWLVGRGRPLLGVEAVRLQGCDPSMLPGLRPESHDSAYVMDLAGNAFCVYQFCVCCFRRLGRGRPYVVDARDGFGSKIRGSGEGRPGPDEAAGPQGSGSGPGARLAIGMASIQWMSNCFAGSSSSNVRTGSRSIRTVATATGAAAAVTAAVMATAWSAS